LKSINQYYNKNLSKNVSQLEKRNHQKWSKKLQRLTDKRNNKINDYLHKASKRIVDICVSNQISNVVVGNVSRSNNKINLGTKTNQNFVNLGLGQLIEKLKYKLACHNIKLTVREESYTSKTSFLDNEKIAKAEKYVGKRAKRGLFISSKGLKINADVNGSYNILRKQTGFSINDLKSKVGNISAWVYPKKETLDSLRA
jgi:putative transposase